MGKNQASPSTEVCAEYFHGLLAKDIQTKRKCALLTNSTVWIFDTNFWLV